MQCNKRDSTESNPSSCRRSKWQHLCGKIGSVNSSSSLFIPLSRDFLSKDYH